ncbi:MAG: hypothetical protein VB058_05730 [Oscillospiraceae bacterium]|nr:hypothetical protein [Oscillospiraceae bacterium]
METIQIFITIGCAILGGLLGYLTFMRSTKKAAQDEGNQKGVILTELGYIKSGIDDIKRRQDKQDDQFLKMSERMATVEASAKQAHHRIDRLEGLDGK